MKARYLGLLEQVIPSSVDRLCALVLSHCGATVDSVSLKEPLTLRGLDGLLHRVRLQLEPHFEEVLRVRLEPAAQEDSLSVSDQLTLHRLCSETNELLGSSEYLGVNRALLDTLFAVLLDFLVAHFASFGSNNNNNNDPTTDSCANQHAAQLPLIKLLPVVARVPSVVLCDTPDNVFVRESASCASLRSFASNVYTAFSEPT